MSTPDRTAETPETLERWVRHDEYCPAVGAKGACNCGLQEALDAERATRQAPADTSGLRAKSMHDALVMVFGECDHSKPGVPDCTTMVAALAATATDRLDVETWREVIETEWYNGNITSEAADRLQARLATPEAEDA